MKSYEEMSEIVLSRIAQERVPLWKRILMSILRNLLIGILTILIICTLFFVATKIAPTVYYFCD